MPLPEPIVVLILAVLQGVAEFLPISSSGHLVVVGHLLGSNGGSGLGVMLHFGTLISIVIFYRRRIADLLSSDRRVLPLLIVGTIPAAAIGLGIKKLHDFGGPRIDWILDDPLLAGFMLVMSGYLLLLLNRLKPGEKEYQKISPLRAFWVGFAQAVALLPGISRSGATIVAGTALGLNRNSAATWSFLLAIPAIGGAMLLESIDLIKGDTMIQTAPQWLAMGVVVSACVGLLSLRLLVKMLDRGQLHWFAYWLIPFGFGVVVWRLKLLVDAIIENS